MAHVEIERWGEPTEYFLPEGGEVFEGVEVVIDRTPETMPRDLEAQAAMESARQEIERIHSEDGRD